MIIHEYVKASTAWTIKLSIKELVDEYFHKQTVNGIVAETVEEWARSMVGALWRLHGPLLLARPADKRSVAGCRPQAEEAIVEASAGKVMNELIVAELRTWSRMIAEDSLNEVGYAAA